MTEAQILDLARYRESDAFSALEKAVLDYAVALSQTPANASDAHRPTDAAKDVKRMSTSLGETTAVHPATAASLHPATGLRAAAFPRPRHAPVSPSSPDSSA